MFFFNVKIVGKVRGITAYDLLARLGLPPGAMIKGADHSVRVELTVEEARELAVFTNVCEVDIQLPLAALTKGDVIQVPYTLADTVEVSHLSENVKRLAILITRYKTTYADNLNLSAGMPL